jgi:hypothetical protein
MQILIESMEYNLWVCILKKIPDTADAGKSPNYFRKYYFLFKTLYYRHFQIYTKDGNSSITDPKLLNFNNYQHLAILFDLFYHYSISFKKRLLQATTV